MEEETTGRGRGEPGEAFRECDLDGGYVSPVSSVRDVSQKNVRSALAGSRYLQILTAITVAGIILRFYNLGFNSIGEDESFTYDFSVRTLSEIWQGTAAYEFNPPLFYGIEHVMLQIGNNEFILRFMPALFGILSIPVFYLVGREFLDRNVGLIAAAGCAFSPFLIYYSQTARAYTLMLFFIAMAALFCLKALKDPSLKNWGIFGVFSAFALWSHYYAIVTITGLVLCSFLLLPRTSPKMNSLKMLGAGITVFILLSLPLIIIIPHFIENRLVSSPSWGIQGLNLITATVAQLSGSDILFAAILSVLFIVGTVQAFRLDKNKGIFLSVIVAFTCAVSYLLSFKISMAERYLIGVAIFFFIGIAVSYRAVYRFWNSRTVVYLVIALVVLTAVPLLSSYYTGYSREDWRGISKSLEEMTNPGDFVVILPANTYTNLNYYYSYEKDRTEQFRVNTGGDLEKIRSQRKNSTLYVVVMPGYVHYQDGNESALVWLTNNARLTGTSLKKQVSLYTYP